MTSRTSAPTASHSPAIAFTKLSLVARKAFEAYLMVSAVAASVISSGAWVPEKSSPTRAATDWSSAPTTMRSGWRLSEHRGALPQELRIGHHRDVVAAEHPLDDQGRAHRHRRLVDDDRSGGEMGADLLGHGFDEREIGRPVVALRGGYAEEDELGPGHRLGRADHEPEPSRRLALVDQLLELVLDDRHLALLEHGDLGRVRVATGHPVTEVGEGGRGRQSDVADADDRHRSPASLRARPVPRRLAWPKCGSAESLVAAVAAGSARPVVIVCPPLLGSTGYEPPRTNWPADSVRSATDRAATSRASASCHVGERRQAREPEGRVVEPRVRRSWRGAGRVELGGGDRLDPVGVEPGGLQSGPGEPEPGGLALVGDVEGAGPPVERETHQARARSAVKVGHPSLVVDEAQRVRRGSPRPGGGPS